MIKYNNLQCRLQANSKEFPSFFRALFKTLKEEKITGLYKGLISPTINQIPVNAM